MPSIFNARLMVSPSFVEPQMIVQTVQPSGFMDLLGDRSLRVRLGPADKFVYLNAVDMRTMNAANQASANLLPSATITAQFLQTATYRSRIRAEYGELDIAEAAEWKFPLPEGQRLAMRAGHFQFIRSAALYGVNAANSEGLINTPNATLTTLPTDSYGNTSLNTYDAGELGLFFLGCILDLLSRTYQLGTPTRIVVLGPQRDIGFMELVDVIQLASFQRAGAGSSTTAEMVRTVAAGMKVSIEWAYDDTLIGKGAGGDDAILMAIPELNVPAIPGINTNVFNTITPSIQAQTLQYADVAAPVEITTPIVEGVDVTSQMRISSGWCPRGEAISVISVPYTS